MIRSEKVRGKWGERRGIAALARSLLLLSVAAMAFPGCSRDKVKVSVRFAPAPKGEPADAPASAKVASFAPTSVSGFDCLFVNVIGEGIGAWEDNKNKVGLESQFSYIGAYSGLISVVSGGTATVEVPNGIDRIVQVVGAKSAVGCPSSVTREDLQDLTKFLGLFLVGKTRMDTIQDQEVQISNAYSQATAKDVRGDSSDPQPDSDKTAPTAGGSVTATAATTSVALSWPAGADNGSPASDLDYKVVRASATTDIDTIAEADAATTVMDWTENVTSTTASGLTVSTAYAFAVLVRDAAGNKALYTPVTTSTGTPDSTAPVPGGGGTVTATPASTSVALSWTAATDTVTAAASLEYKVVRASTTAAIDTVTEADAATTVTDWTANLRSASATGLTEATTYAFVVLVRDAALNKALYTTVSTTTTDATAPTVGGSGTITATPASTSVALSWTAASDAVTAAASLQYKVVRASATAAIDTVAEADVATTVTDWTANLTSASATGLTTSMAYAFVVLVRDAALNTALYTPVSTVTTTVADSTAPVLGGSGTLAATPTQTKVVIAWTAATDAVTSAANLQYKLVQGATTADVDTVVEADSAPTMVNWTANITAATATGLSTDLTYAFNVVVKDQAGNLAIYTPVSVTTALSGNEVVVQPAHRPTGESSLKPIGRDTAVSAAFFHNGAYYQPLLGSSNNGYLLKLGLDGAIDASFGINGYQKYGTITGTPSTSWGQQAAYWISCGGNVYVAWSATGATYALYQLNLSTSPPR
jgi:hypothetical protein